MNQLGPDPETDDFDKLYAVAQSGPVIEALTRLALPRAMGGVILTQLFSFGGHREGERRALKMLPRLFRAGARWTDDTKDMIAAVRSSLLRTSNDALVDLMELLAKDDYCSPDVLSELVRTPAIRNRLTGLGIVLPRRTTKPRKARR